MDSYQVWALCSEWQLLDVGPANLESKQHLTFRIFTAKWMNTLRELSPTRDSGEF